MIPTLDAPAFRRAMQAYAEALRSHEEELNSLNVYPVPDGDTGTNMLLTQESVVAALDALGEAPLGQVGCAISGAALMGARGNSGVILSQVLRGIFEALPKDEPAGPNELTEGLRRAADQAHRAVASPAEGTVLTVLRDAAEAAEAASNGGGDCAAVIEAALEAARRSLARTRDTLPELRQAGVVDAGGKGLVLLLDSLRVAALDEPPSEPIGTLGPVGRGGLQEEVSASADFGFEVQYLLEMAEEAMPALRRRLGELGGSLVVVGGGGLYNVHVHTDQPGPAVEAAVESGRPRNISITSLDGQVARCIGGQARAVQVAEQATALVAVVEGEGLIRTFRSLGAVVVTGRPGSDPSVGDLVAAIQASPAHSVLVVPTHPRLVPRAERAAAESSRDTLVVQTRSVPAGIAASTAFNPLAELQENREAMEEAARLCRSGQLTRAERDAEGPAGQIRRGEWIGTASEEIVSAGNSLEDTAAAVASRLAGDVSELATLVVGADVSAEESEAAEAGLRRALPGVKVEVVDGGQPGSAFLIGVE